LNKTSFKADPEKAALLGIDMQNDFCHERGVFSRIQKDYDVKPLRKTIMPIKNLIQAARNVGIPIIFIKVVNKGTAYQSYIMRARTEGLGIPLKIGTWGAEIVDELKPGPSDYIVEKRRYSAFYNTDLEVLLKGLDAKTLIFTGVTTNVCVESTVRDAIDRDYDIVFVEDCIATINSTLHEATLTNLRYMMGKVTFGKISSSKELVEALPKKSRNNKGASD